MKRKLLLALSSIMLISCGSLRQENNDKPVREIKVTRYKKLKSLKSGKDVKFSKKFPSFSFKKVCHAKLINVDRNIDPKKHVNDMVNIAKKCGSEHVVILKETKITRGVFTGLGAEILVIQKISDNSRIAGNEHKIKQLQSALVFSNTQALGSILTGMRLERNHKYRSYVDNIYLEMLVRADTQRGANCSVKGLNYLAKHWDVRIVKFASYRNPVSKRIDFVNTHKMLECNSKIIKYSLARLKKAEDAITAILNTATNSINKRIMSPMLAAGYINLFPVMSKVTKKSCKKDAYSALCIAAPHMKKVYNVSKLVVKPQYTKSVLKQDMHHI